MNEKFKKWLVESLVTISKQVNNVQRKLDALIDVNPKVSDEQLKELRADAKLLNVSSDSLAQAIEKNKPKG